MKYKYYSEKLDKIFDTVEELESAEKKYDEKILAEQKKKEEQKKRAKEVQEAYANYTKVTNEAYANYKKLFEAYHNDYHTSPFHEESSLELSLSEFFDLLDRSFKKHR